MLKTMVTSAARKAPAPVVVRRPRVDRSPLVVYVGRSLDGTGFALDPISQRRVRDAFPGVSVSTRQVFISHDTSEDLKHTVGRLEEQIAIVLTGVASKSLLAEQFSSVSFRDPRSRREVVRLALS